MNQVLTITLPEENQTEVYEVEATLEEVVLEGVDLENADIVHNGSDIEILIRLK